jgi:hypothetical protein
MKKLLLLAVLTLTIQGIRAQDFKKVQNAFLIGRVEEAKTELDKAMANPKAQSSPEGYFWKAKIFSTFFKDANMRAKYPDAGKEASEALKKYAELDPSFAQVKALGADPYFDMYSAYFQQGVKIFKEEKWDQAADAFANAISYIDEIIKNNWANAGVTFDTTSVLYAAYAYQNAQKLDLAAKYYEVLADHKVKDKSMIDVYRFLAEHYIKAKNLEKFTKYNELGRQLYTANDEPEIWEDYEIQYINKNYTLDEKVALYEKDKAAGLITENKALLFGDIFFNASKDKKIDSAQQAGYSQKAVELFKQAYNINNKNFIAAFNTGIIYYNLFGEYYEKVNDNIRKLQQLNSEKADRPVEKDPKKKAAADAKFKEQTEPILKANAALEKPINENIDQATEWLEKSFALLKDNKAMTNTEKNIAGKTVDYLANMYGYKRDKARGKDPKAFDMYEAKYKEYDALHGKF